MSSLARFTSMFRKGFTKNIKLIFTSAILLAMILIAIFVLAETPSLTLLTPGNGNWVTTTLVPLNCSTTLSGENSTLLNLSVYTNSTSVWQIDKTNGTAVTLGSPYNFTLSLADGTTIIWNCEAFDNGSMSSTAVANYTVKVDASVPLVSLYNYTNITKVTTGSVFYLDAFVADVFSGIAGNCAVFLGSTPVGVLAYDASGWCNGSVTVPAGLSGNYWINVTVNDTAGNKGYNQTFYVVDIDVTPPVVVFGHPAATYVNGTVIVNASVSDSQNPINSVRFRWVNATSPYNAGVYSANMTNPATDHFTGTLDTTTLSDGSYILQFSANDSLGNLNETVNVTVTVDNTVPTIVYVSSLNASGNYKAGDILTINVTFSEIVTAGAAFLELELGDVDRNATYADGSGTTVFNFTYTVQPGDNSADLNYTTSNLFGTIRDQASNPATLTLPAADTSASLAGNKAIVVDTTSPYITIISPIVAGNNVSGTFSVWAYMTDNLLNNANGVVYAFANSTGNYTKYGQLGWSQLVYNGSAYMYNDTVNSTALNDGVYTLWVIANDTNGNLNTTFFTPFRIDNSMPILSGAPMTHGDADNFYRVGNLLNISVNVTDVTTTVRNVTFNLSQVCADTITTVTAPISGEEYSATCTVDVNALSGKVITMQTCDSLGNCNATLFTYPVVLYNFSMPPAGGPVMRFGADTTNLSNVANLNTVNYVLDIELDGDMLPGAPWSGFQDSAMFNFSSLNFTSQTIGAKLALLPTALIVNISAPRTYGANRIYVNSAVFAELNSTTRITLYNLPFTSQPTVAGDVDAGNVNVLSWVGSGTQGNLTINVSGFSGYNETDVTEPTIRVDLPVNNTYRQDFVFSAVFNGTGTEIDNNSINVNLSTGTTAIPYTYANMNCIYFQGLQEVLNCTFTPTLPDAVYNFTVSVKDYGGVSGNLVSTNGINVTVDDTNPSVIYVAPVAPIRQANVILNASVTDNLAGVTFVYFNLTNSTNDSIQVFEGVLTDTFYVNVSTFDTTLYPDGYYNITVHTKDNSNNWNTSVKQQITIDNTAPYVAFSEPAAVSNKSLTFVVNITMTDNFDTNVLGVVYAFDNGTGNFTKTGSAGWSSISNLVADQYVDSVDTLNFADGTYKIWVKANDTLGNLNWTYVTVTMDNTPPAVTFVYPAAGSFVRQTTYVNATASDATLTVSSVRWRWENATLGAYAAMTNPSGTNYTASFDTTSIADGNYTLRLSANDTVNNINASVITSVTVDNTPPVLSSWNYTEATRVLWLNFSETVNLASLNTGLVSVAHPDGTGSFNLSGASFSSASNHSIVALTLTYVQASQMRNLIASRNLSIQSGAVLDRAGNALTSGWLNARPYVLDNIVPSAPALNAIATPTGGSNTVTLSWAVVDEAAYYKVYRNQTLVATSYGNTSVYFNDYPADGDYLYNVSAVSSSLLEGAKGTGASVTVDAHAPSVSASGPTGYIATTSTTLSATTNEAANCSYAVNDTDYSSMTAMTGTATGHTATVSTAQDQPYTFHVKCRDIYQNTMAASSVISFIVNTTGAYNYTQQLNRNWNTLWIPAAAVMESMGYTSNGTNSWNVSTVLSTTGGLGTGYNLVYYNLNGTSSGWVTFIRSDWSGSSLKYVNNINDKPYWINMSSAVRFQI